MSLKGTDLALVSARIKTARIGAFRLGFAPDDVEGTGTVGPGEYAWQERKPEDDGQEWNLMTPWTMCGGKSAIAGGETGGIAASFTAAPNPSIVGQTVQFTDTSTPAAEITFWHWEFGDGAQSDEQHPTHKYVQPGVYTVTLWISSPRGADSATGTQTVGIGARLLVACTSFTVKNTWPSYPGFNGYSQTGGEFLADSTRTALAIIRWLTNKTTGARILILWDGVDDREYGTEWQAAMTSAGHLITSTGATSNFGAYEPLDFDVVCMGGNLDGSSYHGLSNAQAKVDYILSNGGHILGTVQAGSPCWGAYGIGDANPTLHPDTFTGDDFGHHIHFSFPTVTYGPEPQGDGWRNQYPFACAAFGNPGVGGSWGTNLYAYSMPSNTLAMQQTTNTRGGTRTIYPCALPDDKTQFENHYASAGWTGVIGTWTEST